MATYIGTPPGEFVIPVTLGADRSITLQRKDSSGNPQDWGADVYISIDIDKTNPTRVDATVTADQAAILLVSETLDLVKNSTRWRLVMAVGADPNMIETAVAVGTFERHDG